MLLCYRHTSHPDTYPAQAAPTPAAVSDATDGSGPDLVYTHPAAPGVWADSEGRQEQTGGTVGSRGAGCTSTVI